MKILFKQHIFFYILLFFIGYSGIEGYTQSDYTNLVWSDEFDQDGAPQTDKWTFDIGGDGWGNNELQYYTNRPENVRVEGGKLIITALKENFLGSNYTSSRMLSRSKGDWLYGRIEVSARLPEGRGTWPAIWMLPTDWEYGGWPKSGEIDILEHVGYDMGNVHGTVHTEAYNGLIGTQRGGDIFISDLHTAFHVYAVEWEPDSLHFYVDDQHYFSFPNYGTGYERWPFDKRFHLIMNIAIGGNWGGIQGIDDTIFPQTMEVDYVRVYQRFQQQDIRGSAEINAYQQELVYRVTAFPGASYNWTFPHGVTIREGQGTAVVIVDWGKNPGTVLVEQSYNDELYTSTLDVNVIQVPAGDTLIIKGNETDIGSWKINTEGGNAIIIRHEE